MMMMMLLLNVLWASLAVLALISPKISYLKEWSMHGKLREGRGEAHTTTSGGDVRMQGVVWSLWRWFNGFYISKKHFIDFYIIGSIFTTCSIIIIYEYYHKIYDTNDEGYAVILTLTLLLIHLYRRVWEQKYVYGGDDREEGVMHVSAWMLGIGFYILMPLSIMMPTSVVASAAPNNNNNMRSMMIDDDEDHSLIMISFSSISLIIIVVCVSMNITAQYWQYVSHKELATLRKGSSTATTPNCPKSHHYYGIPVGGLFDYISCPHYTCEIIIYVSLCMLRYHYYYYYVTIESSSTSWNWGPPLVVKNISKTSTTTWSTVIPSFVTCTLFVIVNLSINAYNNDRWYRKHFGDKYPVQRYALIPFLF